MKFDIVRLKAEDYDELLDTMHAAFRSPPERRFPDMLPVMWVRDDEHMGKHVAVKDGKKVMASVGIYPFRVMICGEELTFATIGNVATHPDYQGKGLMTELMRYAVEEAKRMGVDMARLGGKRQRYNRFGFENAGTGYQYTLSKRNLKDYYGSSLSRGEVFTPEMRFERVFAEDTENLEFCFRLHQTAPMYVDRLHLTRFYKTLCAWKREVWAAFDAKGNAVGYLCASPDGAQVVEHRALTAELEYKMLLEWTNRCPGEEISFGTAPWETALNTAAGKICESWNIGITSHYNPLQWKRVLNALLKLKAQYCPIPESGFVVEIEDCGRLEFCGAACRETEKTADIVLSHLDAVRFFFGCIPTISTFGVPEACRDYVSRVLPLPLWWCDQDRV